MTDRELLELAAKAIGVKIDSSWPLHIQDWAWNPLTNDGDALRLAVKLNLNVEYDSCPEGVIVFVYGNWDGSPDSVTEIYEGGSAYAVTRRCIVRAAAEIGKQLQS